jgi:hypothetical protein
MNEIAILHTKSEHASGLLRYIAKALMCSDVPGLISSIALLLEYLVRAISIISSVSVNQYALSQLSV